MAERLFGNGDVVRCKAAGRGMFNFLVDDREYEVIGVDSHPIEGEDPVHFVEVKGNRGVLYSEGRFELVRRAT